MSLQDLVTRMRLQLEELEMWGILLQARLNALGDGELTMGSVSESYTITCLMRQIEPTVWYMRTVVDMVEHILRAGNTFLSMLDEESAPTIEGLAYLYGLIHDRP